MNRLSQCAAAILTCASIVALGQGVIPDGSVPIDLRPLLAPHHSEMRLVFTRYTADRTLLVGNYAGTGGGGGRGIAGPPLVISQSRIARLKRFDISWQSALAKIDATRLSPEATTDLADATLVHIAERHSINLILTIDHNDFETYGT